MNLNEIALASRPPDPTKKRLAVVYGGRFQPFHLGHYKAYRWLCNEFGKDNVWIATSNKTNFDESEGDVSPLTFKEKQFLISTLYDIDPDRIVKAVKPTFGPSEVFKKYQGVRPIYVAAVGKKDLDRYTGSTFFKRYPAASKPRELTPVEEGRGYYVTVPMQGKLSGTEVRTKLKDAALSVRREAMERFFGKYDPSIDALLQAKLKDVK